MPKLSLLVAMLRLAGVLLKVLGALLAFGILVILAFNVYFYTRPAPDPTP